jgi:hypothetical protein
MSVEGLRRAIAALDEQSSCTGSCRLTDRLAIMLPDGDVGAVDDPGFVDWLVEHGERGPFGFAGYTLLDPRVRRVVRLIARGAAQISGFDPADILDEIEAALSPRARLVATLIDVLVYPPGGHFVRHKDTPQTPDLLGTLIVGLPIEHVGGAFHIDDGIEPRVVDWSGPVDRSVVPWVALFTDVDHEIKPVESGARVTLVYALTRTEEPRVDPTWHQRIAALSASAQQLRLPEAGPLMIACTRHVIGSDAPQLQSIAALRGGDRDVADVLVQRGFQVNVRTCIVMRTCEWDEEDRQLWYRADDEVTFARLARPLTDSQVAELLGCVTFEQGWWGDGGGFQDEEAESLASYVVDVVPIQNWIVRPHAAATLLREIAFADDGFVGNGAVESYLYRLAALEVTRSG